MQPVWTANACLQMVMEQVFTAAEKFLHVVEDYSMRVTARAVEDAKADLSRQHAELLSAVPSVSNKAAALDALHDGMSIPMC